VLVCFKFCSHLFGTVENYLGLRAWIVNTAKANSVTQLFIKDYFFLVKFIVLLNFRVHAKICVE